MKNILIPVAQGGSLNVQDISQLWYQPGKIVHFLGSPKKEEIAAVEK